MPLQNLRKDHGLKFIELNKLFATRSLAEHGLGFLINIYKIEDNNNIQEKKLLYKMIFDVGSSNYTFIHNSNIRGSNLSDVNSIVLSHWHYDHTGGLYKVLEQIKDEIQIICHEFAKSERFFRRSDEIKIRSLLGKTRQEIFPLLSASKIINQLPINIKKIEDLNGNVVFNKKPYELLNIDGFRIIVAGEIPRIHHIEDFKTFCLLQDDVIKNDSILDDKCIILDYEDKIILLNGCCHSGIMNTLDYIKSLTDKPISHIIGGFHMANASNQRIKKTIEYLMSFQKYENPLYLFPIHCSGETFLHELIRAKSPDLKAFNVSVGTIFTF